MQRLYSTLTPDLNKKSGYIGRRSLILNFELIYS